MWKLLGVEVMGEPLAAARLKELAHAGVEYRPEPNRECLNVDRATLSDGDETNAERVETLRIHAQMAIARYRQARDANHEPR